MPHFFQYSKNGRKALYNRNEKKKKYAKVNDSTMNRICRRFDDIGHINMNVAGIPPFNWQMLMPDGPKVHLPSESITKAITSFCDMDSANLANIIEAREHEDMADKDSAMGYDLVKEAISDELTEVCGSLDTAYPYILKYLFTGDNFHKASHKQMFWRVFGDIALTHLEKNLQDHYICSSCGAKVPSRFENHLCLKHSGFLECVDCGEIVERKNSRQCRCAECQKEHQKINKRGQNSRHYARKIKSQQEYNTEKDEAICMK